MKEAEYAYAVARVRSNEVRLLTPQDIDGLLASGDCARCAARLSDKGWESSGAAADDSEMLRKQTERTWELIDEIAPDRAEFDFLRLPNDFHNLKVSLKARLQQCEWKHLCMFPASVPVEDIEKAVNDKEFDLLPEFMRDKAADAYEALVSWADGQLCEVILDRAALEAASAAAAKIKDSDLPSKLTGLDSFAADVRIAVRAARMKKSRNSVRTALADCTAIDAEQLADAAALGEEAVVEYVTACDREAGETLAKGLSAFERLCRTRRTALLDEHKYDPLGIAPLISYILNREEETRKVRIILAGLRNGVEPDRIRTML